MGDRTIKIIVAIAKNYAIGYQDKLLYWLPNDLKRFKALTTGHTIIMGRKTFGTFPHGALPNRRNIILTRNPSLKFEGAESFGSLKDALEHCSEESEVFIIGGASVYKEALPYADRLYVTQIENTPEHADTFFPEINPETWKEEKRETHPSDDKHPFSYSFIDYIKE